MSNAVMAQACGFCRFGAKHEYCPGAIWNNGKILECPCDCESSVRFKCRRCGSRHDVSKTTLKCETCEGKD